MKTIVHNSPERDRTFQAFSFQTANPPEALSDAFIITETTTASQIHKALQTVGIPVKGQVHTITAIAMAAQQSQKTRLRFKDLASLRAHVTKLESANLTTTGGWTAGQICYHLAAAFEATSEPPPPNGAADKLPLKKLPLRLLVLNGFFPKGLPIPEPVRERLTPPKDADFETERQRLVRSIKLFEQATDQPPPHPVLGPLSRAEWLRFHLRHSELHLKYIVPDQCHD